MTAGDGSGWDGAQGPLATAIVRLATTPDDESTVQALLERIAELGATMIQHADYVSVTTLRGGDASTVAMSNELAGAVDAAQYAGDEGPCLDSAAGAEVAGSDDIATLVKWPLFRETAGSLGVQSVMSVSLFAASGQPLAALNIYSRSKHAFGDVSDRIRSTYEPALPLEDAVELDAGSRDLVSGVARALQLRDIIQQAVGTIMATEDVGPEDAYARLRSRAASQGRPLLATAARTISSSHGRGTEDG